MIKALLTVNDVKAFIMEAITLQKADRILTRKELIKELNLNQHSYEKYIQMGMPWTGKATRKKHVLSHVKTWFIANGIELN